MLSLFITPFTSPRLLLLFCLFFLNPNYTCDRKKHRHLSTQLQIRCKLHCCLNFYKGVFTHVFSIYHTWIWVWNVAFQLGLAKITKLPINLEQQRYKLSTSKKAEGRENTAPEICRCYPVIEVEDTKSLLVGESVVFSDTGVGRVNLTVVQVLQDNNPEWQ
jgi:hypothetical protein